MLKINHLDNLLLSDLPFGNIKGNNDGQTNQLFSVGHRKRRGLLQPGIREKTTHQ